MQSVGTIDTMHKATKENPKENPIERKNIDNLPGYERGTHFHASRKKIKKEKTCWRASRRKAFSCIPCSHMIRDPGTTKNSTGSRMTMFRNDAS